MKNPLKILATCLTLICITHPSLASQLNCTNNLNKQLILAITLGDDNLPKSILRADNSRNLRGKKQLLFLNKEAECYYVLSQENQLIEISTDTCIKINPAIVDNYNSSIFSVALISKTENDSFECRY